MAAHQRYERMAVGHVLGGLDEVDAAAFRSHLLGCSDCRRRVNELREIASDLAATEREERRAASLATVEVEQRTAEGAPETIDVAPVRRWPWGVVVIGLVPLLMLGTLAWAVWLRAESGFSEAVAQSQRQVLEVLASGEQVDWSSPEAITGDVATDGDTVVVNLVGLPELRPDQGLVVWLLDQDGVPVNQTRTHLAPQVADGSLVAALGRPAGASELVISVEKDPVGPAEPTGYRLLSASLPQVSTTGGTAEP